MSKTYVFAGASSKTAIACAQLLQNQNHKVIGISTKEKTFAYDEFYQIEQYAFGAFPKLNCAIDGLVYFPGTIQLKPFQRMSEKDFVNDYQINSLGAVAFAQAFLLDLKNGTAPAIVFISSVAAQTGMPFHSSIAMAKAAIEGLTKALAAELAPSIRVNAIAPSLSNTPLAEKFINTPEKLETSEKRNPLKKVGKATDLANAITFLLGDEASWITGQILAVDGGMGNLKVM
ncbi:MAG: SDR family oxidoreductase [Bacteroidota bacterium]